MKEIDYNRITGRFEASKSTFCGLSGRIMIREILHVLPICIDMEIIELQTKKCPFCAETIHAQAIKCRFCGEFLNSDKARTAEAGPQSPGAEKNKDNILFKGRPSLWGMAGAVIRGLIFLGVAACLIVYPLENLFVFQPDETSVQDSYEHLAEELLESEVVEELAPAQEQSWFGLTEEQSQAFAHYRKTAGIALASLVVLVLLMKTLKLKMTYYEVTADRIEWSRGIFDRKVDNLDMFRVIDLKMRRSLLDCIVGVGTVGLITTDKTDPKFTFQKIRQPRRLYDIIKKASLEADKQRGVFHLE